MAQVPFAAAAMMVIAAVVLVPAQDAPAAAQAPAAPEIAVTDAAGVYRVSAEFVVAAPAGVVSAVLMDFERIPEFMPDVKTSQVVARHDSGLVVEQEAAAKFMLFSKRIHLVLDVSAADGTIRFRDRCGKSFAQYQGAWRLRDHGDATAVVYELSAKPSFEVPAFVLKRLLKRDAAAMIGRLQAEIVSRAATR